MDRLSQQYKLKGTIFDKKYKDKKYVTYKIFKVSSIEKRSGKMKAVSYLNNYSDVKLMVTSLMAGNIEAERRKIDIDYITNIKVKADETLIYNVNVSPCLAANPLLKFSYKDIKPISLTLEYTDNKGKTETSTIRVRPTNKVKPISEHLKLSPNANSYPNKIESIKKLFGDIYLIEDGIQLTTPKLAENGGSIPISIRSDIQFKSIALFMKGISNSNSDYNFSPHRDNCGEEDKYKLVSQWFTTPYSIANFNLRVKIKQDKGKVLVVLEAKNGKFYTIKQEFDTTHGCGGGD